MSNSFEFRVHSLGALREQYPAGSYATGPSFVLPEAVFALTVYPNGKTEADKDFVASYLSVQRLTQHGLEAVKIPATWSLHAVNDNGDVLHRISSSRAEFLSDVTVAGKVKDGSSGGSVSFVLDAKPLVWIRTTTTHPLQPPNPNPTHHYYHYHHHRSSSPLPPNHHHGNDDCDADHDA